MGEEEKITDKIVFGNMSIREFIYRLFFTREDSLDVLQLMFTVIVILALVVVWNLTNTAEMSDAVIIESLVTLRWMIGLLVVTAVPKWLVPFMVNHTKSVQQSQLKKIEEEWDEPTEETNK
jgi:hypothetical protein